MDIKPNMEFAILRAGSSAPDTTERIRVLAEHPRGDWFFEVTQSPDGLVQDQQFETVSQHTLKKEWFLLPERVTVENVEARLREIDKAYSSHDVEAAMSKINELYVAVLQSIAIWPMERAEQIELSKKTLEGLEEVEKKQI